ncbi:hypothetical protein ACIBO5_45455 [Nonomuraea angiospora]|uniref:hypothetical protein n=1 Tax=Nonomuraea TaxID=83681 RepID=UPI0029A9199C|nr:hypothetical protein [Nonomuraea angiospora]MDX3104756.1 hypothetical protein [Nonomuraea angiospora]
MRITDAKVIVTSPGRNHVTLKTVTDTRDDRSRQRHHNGREPAVAATCPTT